MDNGTSIKALLSQISPKGPVLIKGKVISSSPLRIQALNDEKLIMSEKTLVVPGRIGKLIDKAFGNYVYSQKLSRYEGMEYCVKTLEESIKDTEGLIK